jgi:malate dehydrogenase (oxaloacetate-decarboxylating)(NADP+)
MLIVGFRLQIAQYFVQQGVPEAKAKEMITLVDSKGLVADNRGDRLPQHKRYFSKADPNTPRLTNLHEVVEHYKPTALLGLSTVRAAFSEDILRSMAKQNERPIIFALSNPLTQAECTFEEAIQWTDGKALFASGSPFADVTWHGKTLINNQGNNV